MPTYAVFGATGSTGSVILRFLHERGGNTIHAYARSAQKMRAMHPYTAHSKAIRLFIGELSDDTLIRSCLTSVSAVFAVVAQNNNQPGCSIAQRSAQAIVSALESLKAQDANFVCPTVVFLSSASLDPAGRQNAIIQYIVDRANYYVYADITKALAFIEERTWILLIVAEPGALVHATPVGFTLSQTDFKGASPLLAYEDLGRAMVQMVEDGEWAGQKVGIATKAKPDGSIWWLIKNEFWGLVAFYTGWG